MADFIRPEVKSALWRMRDIIAALAVAGVGVMLVIGGRGVLPVLGWVLIAAGAGLLVAGVQRTRFRRGDGGPGVVQVTERRLAYFGPLSGGMIDVADIVTLSFDPTGHPAPYWVVTGPDHRDIAIPTTATGAEALFDCFGTLPGLRADDLLRVLDHPPAQRVVIWSRTRQLLH